MWNLQGAFTLRPWIPNKLYGVTVPGGGTLGFIAQIAYGIGTFSFLRNEYRQVSFSDTTDCTASIWYTGSLFPTSAFSNGQTPTPGPGSSSYSATIGGTRISYHD